MEHILDLEEKPKGKSSWKPVLITNGVLIISFLVIGYLLFLQVTYFSLPIATIIINGFRSTFFLLLFVNLLCVFTSLFFFKPYWKKWLIMAGFCVILLFVTLLSQLIIDVSKFDLSA